MGNPIPGWHDVIATIVGAFIAGLIGFLSSWAFAHKTLKAQFRGAAVLITQNLEQYLGIYEAWKKSGATSDDLARQVAEKLPPLDPLFNAARKVINKHGSILLTEHLAVFRLNNRELRKALMNFYQIIPTNGRSDQYTHINNWFLRASHNAACINYILDKHVLHIHYRRLFRTDPALEKQIKITAEALSTQ